jgi:hypothetical protein
VEWGCKSVVQAVCVLCDHLHSAQFPKNIIALLAPTLIAARSSVAVSFGKLLRYRV